MEQNILHLLTNGHEAHAQKINLLPTKKFNVSLHVELVDLCFHGHFIMSWNFPVFCILSIIWVMSSHPVSNPTHFYLEPMWTFKPVVTGKQSQWWVDIVIITCAPNNVFVVEVIIIQMRWSDEDLLCLSSSNLLIPLMRNLTIHVPFI